MKCGRWKQAMFAGLCVATMQTAAIAQTPVTPPTDTGAPPVPTTTTTFSLKQMWFEVVITAGMAGLALFAVCKSSARQ